MNGRALNLAQAVLVLALGGLRAGAVTPGAIERTLAGAVLLELTERGCLTEDGGQLLPVACAEPDDELLADSLALLRAALRPRDAAWWIERLPRELAPVRERVARPLVERGVLAHERSMFSGPYGGMRFPEHDREPERQLRARLAEVLLGQREPTPREAILIVLLRRHGLELEIAACGRDGDVSRRASEIAVRADLRGAERAIVRELEGA